MNKFYVYMYLRETDSALAKAGTPYYIGKGHGRRAWRTRGKYEIRPPKDLDNIVYYAQNLSENDALELEKVLIARYGRADIGTGILRNKTDGGDGVSGYRWSEELKRQHSLRMSGKPPVPRTVEWKARIAAAHLGKKKGPMSSQHKAAISRSALGNTNAKGGPSKTGQHLSAETKKKISNALKGRKLQDLYLSVEPVQ